MDEKFAVADVMIAVAAQVPWWVMSSLWGRKLHLVYNQTR
jgi:hypothetical protein